MLVKFYKSGYTKDQMEGFRDETTGKTVLGLRDLIWNYIQSTTSTSAVDDLTLLATHLQ